MILSNVIERIVQIDALLSRIDKDLEERTTDFIKTKGITAYFVVASKERGYYIYQDNDTALYAREAKLTFNYDEEETEKVEEIKSNPKSGYILMGVVIVCVVVLLLISHPINLVNQGKAEAQTKGINYNFYRGLIIVLATVLTAISVCFCGTISWIGLVIPHIVRLLAGRDAKRTIPLCITFGGTFMILVDVLSRTFTDSEIPLSAVTGLLGTVIFVVILIIKRRKLNEHKDI